MCVLKLPHKLFELFDCARRHCIWRKVIDGDAKMPSLVAWYLICRPKNKGGLGKSQRTEPGTASKVSSQVHAQR